MTAAKMTHHFRSKACISLIRSISYSLLRSRLFNPFASLSITLCSHRSGTHVETPLTPDDHTFGEPASFPRQSSPQIPGAILLLDRLISGLSQPVLQRVGWQTIRCKGHSTTHHIYIILWEIILVKSRVRSYESSVVCPLTDFSFKVPRFSLFWRFFVQCASISSKHSSDSAPRLGPVSCVHGWHRRI